MKQLFTSRNFAEVGMLQSLLEAEGIACVTRNEHLAIAAGRVPFFECYPELWVLHDEDYARAQEWLARRQSQADQPLSAWTCPNCGEEMEGQFASCWQCGCERKGTAP